MPGNQGYFWCTTYLSSSFGVFWDSESVAVLSHCVRLADLQREGEEAWARWEPIWTDPTSCQLSPQWLGTLPTHQQPSKGACPPAHPKWAASSMSPSPHYWQKRGKSKELLNHPATLKPQGRNLQFTVHCVNSTRPTLWLFYRFSQTDKNKLQYSTTSALFMYIQLILYYKVLLTCCISAKQFNSNERNDTTSASGLRWYWRPSGFFYPEAQNS